MSVLPGSRLGPYEIVSPLGAGGMGEVYRARDSKLNRDVAIKVLPAAFAEDRDRVARFRREAQLVASLNHPNIAAIYGLEESNGNVALALELVDGEDLAQRLTRGPIAVDEALAIARQIADGLEAAHEKGIVHRDLKPANVKLTKDGVVKILDFGLAKAYEGEPGSHDSGVSQSPTMSRNMTEAGMILGTAAYMSPEQARGRPVDKRADIWSFGVVLDEMLTGKRLFGGETVSDTLAAVLRQDVDLGGLPAETPASVRRLLARCLERDSRKRLRDIGEARLVLADPAAETASSGVPLPVSAGAPPRRGVPIVALLAVALSAAAVGAFTWARVRPTAPARITRFTISLPAGQTLSGNGGPAITRDGRAIAYTARDAGGIGRLYVRALDRFEPVTIPESEGAQQPFFSPDGTRVGFIASGKLFTAAVGGGAPTPIADASAQPQGASWGDDGTIVFSPALSSGLMRVNASGGKIEQLTAPDEGAAGYAHVRPQLLPGSRSVLFTIWGPSSLKLGPALLSLPKGTWKHISSDGWTARYAASGHILQSGPRGLRAAPFDPESPKPVNPQTFVVDDVLGAIAFSDSWFAVSDNGTLVYVPGELLKGTLAWVTRDGRVTPLFDKPAPLSDPLLSPDGERVAFQDRDDVLWTMELRRGTRIRLSFDGEGVNAYPVWSRDGTRVVWSSNRTGDWDIYSAPAAGGPVTKILTRKGNQFALSLAPDGTLLFNERSKAGTGANLMTLSPDGTVAPFLVSQPASKAGGQFSPDGSLVAYVSDETGRDDVYVRPFRGRGDAIAVSSDGGNAPKWSPDGTELFYRRADAFLAATVTRKGDEIIVGDPRKLFELKVAPGRSSFQAGYSLSPDGRRLLVQVQDPRALPTQMNIVQNWFEELSARVPAR
ncbi:MAG: protein kinase [Thermoanaerobaculia bacterium]